MSSKYRYTYIMYMRMSNNVGNRPEFYSRSSVLQYRLMINYTYISRLICFLISAYFLVLISGFYKISWFFSIAIIHINLEITQINIFSASFLSTSMKVKMCYFVLSAQRRVFRRGMHYDRGEGGWGWLKMGEGLRERSLTENGGLSERPLTEKQGGFWN